MVYMANVTLQVPKQDFLILLSAANRGPQWKSGADSTANLISRISVFKPKQFDRMSLILSEFMCV